MNQEEMEKSSKYNRNYIRKFKW